MKRLRVFLVLSVLLALATALAACGGDDGGSGDPKTVLEDATFEGIESADLDLSLGIDVKGEEGGSVDVSLSGPFQSRGDETPELDLTARADGSIGGEDVDFEGGLVLMPNKAFVNYEGTSYEVDPTTYSFVEAMFKELQKQGEAESDQESADVTACQEAAGELEVGNFVDNLSDDGSAKVGGVSTTKVSGDLDVPGAFDSLIDLLEEPACKKQLGAAGPLPPTAEIEQAQGDVEEALKETHVDLYVGEDDIVRRISALFTIEAEEEGEGPETIELKLDLSLTGVNEEQAIAAPRRSKPLGDLFLKLGVNPLELAGAAEGGLGGLLEGLGSATGGGESSAGGGGSSGGGQQAYLNCLKGASSPVDIQRCTEKLK